MTMKGTILCFFVLFGLCIGQSFHLSSDGTLLQDELRFSFNLSPKEYCNIAGPLILELCVIKEASHDFDVVNKIYLEERLNVIEAKLNETLKILSRHQAVLNVFAVDAPSEYQIISAPPTLGYSNSILAQATHSSELIIPTLIHGDTQYLWTRKHGGTEVAPEKLSVFQFSMPQTHASDLYFKVGEKNSFCIDCVLSSTVISLDTAQYFLTATSDSKTGTASNMVCDLECRGNAIPTSSGLKIYCRTHSDVTVAGDFHYVMMTPDFHIDGVQHGTTTSEVVTFPTPFTTTPVVMIQCVDNSGPMSVVQRACTTTGCSFESYIRATTTDYTSCPLYYWIAALEGTYTF